MFYSFKPDPRARAASGAGPEQKTSALLRKLCLHLNGYAQKVSSKKLKVIFCAAGAFSCAAAGLLVYGGVFDEPARNSGFDLQLPQVFGSISVPESLSRQQALDDYLDSLQKAFLKDSIQNAQPVSSHE